MILAPLFFMITNYKNLIKDISKQTKKLNKIIDEVVTFKYSANDKESFVRFLNEFHHYLNLYLDDIFTNQNYEDNLTHICYYCFPFVVKENFKEFSSWFKRLDLQLHNLTWRIDNRVQIMFKVTKLIHIRSKWEKYLQ